jgi:hypothetical protein
MSVGYSLRLVKLNKAAGKSLGAQLGRVCIENNVPVASVAEHLGVSRQTVYSWFIGVSKPRSGTEERIKAFITSMQR